MSSIVVSSLEVRARVGAGHFGEVFEAHHPVHKTVAVKKLSRLPGESPSEWEIRWKGLLEEGRRLREAEHPRVVRVHDVTYSATDDSIFLVMEMCVEGSLEKLYKRGPLPIQDCRRYLTDVALGLQAVHERGMVHRDIKPGNVMLDGNTRAKLGDFGLVTDNVVVGYASAQGYVDHLAPEVFTDGQTSRATDVWALGMTTYRLLHGHDFYGTLPAPRDRILEGNFARRLPFLPHVPDRWCRFVRKMMQDDPHQRYRAAGQVLTALGSLPIEPNWVCQWGPDHTLWHRTTGSREQRVVLEVSPGHRGRWSAVSRPLPGASGRERRLGGSGGVQRLSICMKELRKFMST